MCGKQIHIIEWLTSYPTCISGCCYATHDPIYTFEFRWLIDSVFLEFFVYILVWEEEGLISVETEVEYNRLYISLFLYGDQTGQISILPDVLLN